MDQSKKINIEILDIEFKRRILKNDIIYQDKQNHKKNDENLLNNIDKLPEWLLDNMLFELFNKYKVFNK